MKDLKERVEKRLNDEKKTLNIDNIFDILEDELEQIVKKNGNDSTLGSIIRNMLNG